MEEKKLIEFRNIVKNFDGQIVLKGINLDIYENEFVTLLGPSGCGKTTLLRILGGFLEADEGKVIFDGEEISQKPPYERELNTVFQKNSLSGTITTSLLTMQKTLTISHTTSQSVLKKLKVSTAVQTLTFLST